MLKLQEDEAKRRKLSEQSYSNLKEYHSDSAYSNLKEYHSDSDNEDETFYTSKGKDQGMETIGQTKYDNVIQSLRETILKSREGYPMPGVYHNVYANDGSDSDGNCRLRFDDIGQEASVYHFVPSGLRHIGINYRDCSFGSRKYGFVTFPNHHVARRFLHEFNGLEIPGTGLTYKLSWAPFLIDRDFIDTFVDDVNRRRMDDVFTYKDVEEGDKIEELFNKFYSSLHEKAHKEKRAFWSWPLLEGPDYLLVLEDDGYRTAHILLSHVDPAIKEHQLKDLFGCFGKCTVNLFDNCFSGIVKFEDRRSAIEAYEKFAPILPEKGICYCNWAIEIENLQTEWYTVEENEWGPRKVQYHPYCPLLGNDCPHKDEILQLMCQHPDGQKFKLGDFIN